MASLVDVAPITETVSVRGVAVAVTGIGARGIAELLVRFPQAREMMAKRSFDVETILGLGADAVAVFIAAGTGAPGNAAAEAAADGLLLEEQADLIAAIIRISAPGGLGPLVERLTGLLDAGGASGSAPATKSRPPSKR